MPDQSTTTPSPAARLRRAVPAWKKKVLLIALAAATLGGGVRAAALISGRHEVAAAKSEAAASEAPAVKVENRRPAAPSAGFVNGSARPAATPADSAETPDVSPANRESAAPPELPPTRTDRLGGWLVAAGLSLFAGMVLGVMFRAFVKTAAAVTAVLLIGVVALSYFQLLPIDFATMRNNYDSISPWLTDHLAGLKGVVLSHLPSATAATAGFFLGFLRK